jgi:Kdo2-lipid IVA lauroyltransferase/acyltransferase
VSGETPAQVQSPFHIIEQRLAEAKQLAKRKGHKQRSLQVLEYLALRTAVAVSHLLPLKILYAVCGTLGHLFYLCASRRRSIALGNLRYAYPESAEGKYLKALARESCSSFCFTAMEIIKLRLFLGKSAGTDDLTTYPQAIRDLFTKAKAIHDQSHGCIFVTPHLGNWELLPLVSSMVGIPLAVVVRPLDNPFLEQMLYAKRAANGHVLIPKRNAFFALQKLLQGGKSIGMLPDQSTKKGILVDFMGRKAMTTPIPAVLAVTHRRPVVVVACCRNRNSMNFEGFVSDPIWPAAHYASEKAEIIRITEAIHREMETVIHRYPEQYLWMHDRWKDYRTKKQFLG